MRITTAPIAEHIKQAIIEQERLGLDVLVHGEAERNDMVEYFGEHLDGFVFTQNDWVQSYGSRCVKPPVVIGDVSRPEAITVEWAKLCPVPDRQAGKRHADRSGDHSLLVVPARRRDP